MRKMLMALVVMFLMTGLVIAASGVVTKVDGNKVTIKDGDTETVYTVNDSTKYSVAVKDEKKDSDLKALEKASMRKGKDGKVAGVKVEFEAKEKVISTISWKGGGKGK